MRNVVITDGLQSLEGRDRISRHVELQKVLGKELHILQRNFSSTRLKVLPLRLRHGFGGDGDKEKFMRQLQKAVER